MAPAAKTPTMPKPYKHLYQNVCSLGTIILAWKKARKGKTKRPDVIEFEKNLKQNLFDLQFELKSQTYKPMPLTTFPIRDPKTRLISKSSFRDRIIHHVLINVIGPLFEKSFIYDSCANQKGKGNLFALKRFDQFIKKVSRNGIKNSLIHPNHVKGHILKADIKHYFQEVDHEVLMKTIRRKISDEKTLWLIKKIVKPNSERRERENNFGEKGMPLGNLTSQFFANVYLNELDYFIKHTLKAKFYVRYVDDFIILHNSKEQLEIWKKRIQEFLIENLKLELHKDKSHIAPLARGIDFVGFRKFYYVRLLRRRNLRKMLSKVKCYSNGKVSKEQILSSFQGWNAYAKHANAHRLRQSVLKEIYSQGKLIQPF